MAHQTVRTWDADLVPSPAGRTDRPDPGCPVETALAAITGRWTTLVLRDLMHGPLTYSALRASLPQISDKVLTERLAVLRDRGLVRRDRRPGFPSQVTYALTDAGEQLRPLLIELYRTGERLLRR
ncbi:winged helix-turn-helix transcriptional regulator [Amycolatopsis plumensis]|uniref:Winged helix-turn-helix transcriptional regulator n=1 Tax=Amycolatopsis plumensis TaxID=236508 RepID=A0ABV5U5E0_9PSEU